MSACRNSTAAMIFEAPILKKKKNSKTDFYLTSWCTKQINISLGGYYTTAKLHNSAKHNNNNYNNNKSAYRPTSDYGRNYLPYRTLRKVSHRLTIITVALRPHPSVYQDFKGVQISSVFNMVWKSETPSSENGQE